jgi:hypothetical protein
VSDILSGIRVVELAAWTFVPATGFKIKSVVL